MHSCHHLMVVFVLHGRYILVACGLGSSMVNCDKTLRYKAVVNILGIYVSRALNTIDRATLLVILEAINDFKEESRRLIL